MADYRRWYVAGGTVFFTVVTCRRRRLSDQLRACQLLGECMRDVRSASPYQTVAAVLLPDHLHAVWSLPPGDGDYSTRWKKIKREFTARWLASGGNEVTPTRAQSERGNRGVWQKRFYERQIRDEEELATIGDYIHFNPVKHGYVDEVKDWRFSTFHRFVRAGEYDQRWGRRGAEPSLPFECE